MPSIAVYPGSFDPPTNGHVDIVQRSRQLFDKVVIAILRNPQKQPMFALEERLGMLREIYGDDEGVEVRAFDGLLVDFARTVRARAIIRGMRAATDFEYEFQMALMNRRLAESIETLFMVPREEYTFVSSSLIKEVASLGGAVTGLVPEIVERRLREKLRGGAEE